jgi:hypothetical protein
MTFDDLAHLTGPECEGDRTGNIDFVSDLEDSEVTYSTCFGGSMIGGRVFDDDIPSFGCSRKEMFGFIERAILKTLRVLLKKNGLIRICQRSFVGTNIHIDVSFGLV